MYTKSEEDNLESEHLQKIFFDNHICIPGRRPGNFSKFLEFGKTQTLNPRFPPPPFFSASVVSPGFTSSQHAFPCPSAFLLFNRFVFVRIHV